jgi:hypothetical protein
MSSSVSSRRLLSSWWLITAMAAVVAAPVVDVAAVAAVVAVEEEWCQVWKVADTSQHHHTDRDHFISWETVRMHSSHTILMRHTQVYITL